MGVDLLKKHLHLRIEQADAKLLSVLAEVTESLFKSYQPEALEQSAIEIKQSVIYTKHLQPLTRQELTTEIEESMAEYERGEYLTLEESSKEAGSW